MAHFVPETYESLTFEILISNLSRELYVPSTVDFSFLIYELIRNVTPPATKKHKKQTHMCCTNRVDDQWEDCIQSSESWEEARHLGHIPPPVAKDATRSHTAPILNQSINPFIYPTVQNNKMNNAES